MRAPCLRKTFVVLTLVFVVSSFMAYYICTSLHLRLIFSANLSKKSTVEETTEPAEKSKNHLDEFEVYLRYTSSIKQFPLQAESWILRSMSLFWPKNSKVVVVLDKESEEDKKYGSTLNETTQNKKLDLRVCYMEPYPQEMIHHWGKMRMYMDMMHADLCTNATYVGLVDVDTLFTTAVTPNLILEDRKPVVTGRIGDPRIPCWIESAAYILGRKQVMQCMHYFPVTFKTAHIRAFRQYVAKLHGKNFKQVISETTHKLNIRRSCYCHYSTMCNYMWYNHRNEYAWHLQYVKPTRPALNASVPYDYFFTEVKPEEKIPYPRSSMHVRHFMLNGKYMDAREPTVRFVNDTLVEGLCYSFGIKLCGDLCREYNQTNIHVNLFNFENYDWLWDSRCIEKQIEHYKNVTDLFNKRFFYVDSSEEVCQTIASLRKDILRVNHQPV